MISFGGEYPTFQFVSSVGSGKEYGTATPFFNSLRAASSGCRCGIEGIDRMKVWRESRNLSSGGILEGLGRTFGSSASI